MNLFLRKDEIKPLSVFYTKLAKGYNDWLKAVEIDPISQGNDYIYRLANQFLSLLQGSLITGTVKSFSSKEWKEIFEYLKQR